MAAVARKIRRVRPAVWKRAGTVLEGTVMVFPFVLLFQIGLPPDWPPRLLFGRFVHLAIVTGLWAGALRAEY
jgi:hypothetical protein